MVYYIQKDSTKLENKEFDDRSYANQWINDFMTGVVMLISENGRTTYFRDMGWMKPHLSKGGLA